MTYSSTKQVVVLFGSSGSGKTYWKNWFVKNGFQDVKSITTRKPRSPEEEEYNFVSEDLFFDLLKKRSLFNVNRYLGEYYGCFVDDFCWDVDEPSSTPLVMVSDVSSLVLLQQEFSWRLPLKEESRNKLIVNFVECKPREDVENLLKERGTPERVVVAFEEQDTISKLLEKEKARLKIHASISNEEEARAFLSRTAQIRSY